MDEERKRDTFSKGEKVMVYSASGPPYTSTVLAQSDPGHWVLVRKGWFGSEWVQEDVVWPIASSTYQKTQFFPNIPNSAQ